MRVLVNFFMVLLLIFGYPAFIFTSPATAIENCSEEKLRDLQIAILDCSEDQVSTTNCRVSSSGKLLGKIVYMIGDSVAKTSNNSITSSFSSEGALSVDIDAENSRIIGTATDSTSGIGALTNGASFIASSDKVVIELGSYGGISTNDITNVINLIKAAKSGVEIYWVNIGVNNNLRDSPLDVSTYNDLLNSNQSAGYKVIDWAKEVQNNPNYINSDTSLGLLPSNEGETAFANLITKSIGLSSFCNANLAGSDAQEQAFNFFTDNGYTPEQAAGIVGNLIHESGVEPMRLQGTRSGVETPSDTLGLLLTKPKTGGGIVQWTPPSKMVTRSIEAGITSGEVDTLAFQLQFLLEQLEGTGLGGRSSNESSAGNNLKNTINVEEAAASFAIRYERCADCSAGSATVLGRVTTAIDVLTRYGS